MFQRCIPVSAVRHSISRRYNVTLTPPGDSQVVANKFKENIPSLGKGGRLTRKGIYTYIVMTDSLLYGRNRHNIVKQLNSKKNKCKLMFDIYILLKYFS